MKSFSLRLLILFLLILSPHAVFADDPFWDPFYSDGMDLNQGPLMHSIVEDVDPFSGNLNIVQTDLEFPQNGGLELKIMRFYNSAIWNRRDLNKRLIAEDRKSPLGIGWYMHMGIVINPPVGPGFSGNPTIELPDGTRKTLYLSPSGSYITKDFWVFKTVPSGELSGTVWELVSPQGVIYTLQYSPNGGPGYIMGPTLSGIPVAQVIKIQNPGKTSTIEVAYAPHTSLGRTFYFISKIIDSVGRGIDFKYDDPSHLHQISAISYKKDEYPYDEVTYTYQYVSYQAEANCEGLEKVTLPEGDFWGYAYGNACELKELNYPTGGKISYGYNDIAFPTGEINVSFMVVKTRQTSGRNIVGGTWTYDYTHDLSDATATTTIDAPDQIEEVHTFHGWENGSSLNGDVWRVGLPISFVKKKNGVQIYSETNEWSSSKDDAWGLSYNYISVDDLTNAHWLPTNGSNVLDSFIYVPLLKKKTIEHEYRTLTTTYNSYDDYGNPTKITEAGDATRITETTYWYDIAHNIVTGHPETVTVKPTDPDPYGYGFTTRFGYWETLIETPNEPRVGLLKNTERYVQDDPTTTGVVTTYDYYTDTGNLKKITDGAGRWQEYIWDKGRVKLVYSSQYGAPPSGNPILTRSINSDGTIHSETHYHNASTSFTTSYTYDDNLRLTGIIPPSGANPTNITYPNNESRLETQGAFVEGTLVLFEKEYHFDGFGRPSGTSDSRGVTTGISYTAYGTKGSTWSNIGDTIFYDDFERVSEIEHQGGGEIRYVYNQTGLNRVTIYDEDNYPTELNYHSFGNPAEKRLVSVKDADNKITYYNYNILGRLRTIYGAVPTRSFTYYPENNLLQSETHPETGTTTYTRYSNGLIRTKRENTDTLFTYFYDNNNRLSSITRDGQAITYGYDMADNLTSLISPGADLGFTYDGNNRLETKTAAVANRTYITGYNYDGNSNIQQITYPTGRTVTFVNDLSTNRVTSITNFVSDVTYELTGQPKIVKLANDVVVTYAYDERYINTDIDAVKGLYNPILDLEYFPDDRGNIEFIKNYLVQDESKDQSFGYDALNRITTFTGPWGNGVFGYNPQGNRLSKQVGNQTTTYNYNVYDNNNRLDNLSEGTSITATYDYKDNGYLWGGTLGTLTYALDYDAFNNLNFFTDGVQQATYKYDGNNMRVLKTIGGQSIVYHYGQGGNVLSETDTAGNLIADYVYLNGQLIAKVVPDPIPDSDGDGIPDDWETANGLNPLNAGDATLDGDSDGLDNLGEYLAGTIPNNPDSDNDGMSDGWEVNNNLNPLDAGDATLDSDEDGWTNLIEFQRGTDPNNEDSDGDGILDGMEDIINILPAINSLLLSD